MAIYSLDSNFYGLSFMMKTKIKRSFVRLGFLSLALFFGTW